VAVNTLYNEDTELDLNKIQQYECANKCQCCFTLQSELNDVRIELKSAKDIINILKEDLDLVKQYDHNLREHESSYRVASLHGNWTSVSSKHSAKKNYSVVTSYQSHVSTENCFQILDSLKESDSPV
jgi:hypothetical protein